MGWVRFTGDYDHRWTGGAVTAFKDGMVVHVKKAVEEEAVKLGVAESTTKPDGHDEGYRPTPTYMESNHAPVHVRRAPRNVKRGGAVLAKPGNPVTLPDASDPKARR